MRGLLEQLRVGLAEFVVQRDHLVLSIACTDSDGAMVTKALEALDESSGSELYWCVTADFGDEAAYVEACVGVFAAKHDAARLVLANSGEGTLPEMPSAVADPGRLPPLERLRRLLMFSRSLLPGLSGCAVVWGFVPGRIADPADYARFMSGLWTHEFPFPWCHHMRMVIRDTFPQSAWPGRASHAPRVRYQVLDLSPEAIRQALEDEAGDDSATLTDRVNNALILAGIDYGHGRHERAIQQYELVHRYAATTRNATLAAIALNGLGESHLAAGREEQASVCLRSAVAPAAQAMPPPVTVLLVLYTNLGNLSMSQQRWQEAEVYMRGAAEFALLLHEPEPRLRAWEVLGEAQYHQAKASEAIKTWTDGAIVSTLLDRRDDRERFIARVREHYVATRDEVGYRTALWRIDDEVKARTPETNAAASTATVGGAT